jgi:predicted enzyme related to lactoylglutathione lyase
MTTGHPLATIGFVTMDCSDPERLAAFWGVVFGTEVEERFGDGYVILRRQFPEGPAITFQKVPEPKTAKNRLHFDLRVDDIDAATKELEAIGAVRAPEGDFEEEGYRWRVMRDPEDNEFCVALIPE